MDNQSLEPRGIKPEESPSLVLAYIGDAVYELAVREYLVQRGMVKVNQLHRTAVKYVRAGAQAKALFSLEDKLSEEEMAVVRRGRNAKSGTPPKGACVLEYRHATALEALIGYLYFKERHERVREIISMAVNEISRQ
ncbi:Mini-ribonuclease 3 [Desulforamulus ruminis]|uniref:Mini-ribonuclease 3 n=1 Tax=Desulforamulus ruminis (strain ATCC 23193 / DSM 2154 / NCIMB 8452 / DL) TaxID=696281 RepID=F6DNN3_DESRL|nr:ribonuclease III domain-containing protein [Desulforamulus ruminis]AEG58573.1 ribonuclease III [Desulforamulus ruminis DSM 2154]